MDEMVKLEEEIDRKALLSNLKKKYMHTELQKGMMTNEFKRLNER